MHFGVFSKRRRVGEAFGAADVNAGVGFGVEVCPLVLGPVGRVGEGLGADVGLLAGVRSVVDFQVFEAGKGLRAAREL